MEYMVEARAMTLGYRRKRVFHEATFTIPTGVVGLLGPNGAGKSTLMRAMVGLATPTAGELRVCGRPVSRNTRNKSVGSLSGFLAQNAPYDPRFTVREHVEYCAWLKGMPRTHIADAVARAIEAVGLTGETDTRIGVLSGGMARRATIAGTIVSQPRLLVLDEPTVGLDPGQRTAFQEIIKDLSQHASVLLSTHLVEDVAACCDHVALLVDGRITSVSSIEDLAGPNADAIQRVPALNAAYLHATTSGSQAGK
ncbi:ABC transporter ATP-binding protein [Jonesia quinghaiensis]|uniref:ABC transporter ATP-binding protein n=1 Tax=Jonesia quinghaiensis TaxID=262806 RepID=UPI0009FD5B12|nr:ATP-binding cassette domain-containing protein [Jonesia quinghaiensis]